MLVAPYLLALTPTEQQGMSQMGEKIISIVEKAYDLPNRT
jgi:hypothetical protein